MRGDVVRAAGLAGGITVAVAAGPNRLDIEAFAVSGGLEGAELEVVVTLPSGKRVDLRPRPCGAGCFTQRFQFPRGTTTLEVTATAPGWQGGSFTAAIQWPRPPEEPKLLQEVVTRLAQEPRGAGMLGTV